MNKVKLSAISAMAENRVIGKDNALIWHIPGDLKHFKNTTMGKPVIMGRKSFDAAIDQLGTPFPGRPHVVISRREPPAPDQIPDHPEGVWFVQSIDEGIEKGREIAAEKNLNEIFITGGGELYKQTLDRLDRLYLTIIHRDYDGDTYFPEFDWSNWTVTDEEKHEGDPSFTIYTLDRS